MKSGAFWLALLKATGKDIIIKKGIMLCGFAPLMPTTTVIMCAMSTRMAMLTTTMPTTVITACVPLSSLDSFSEKAAICIGALCKERERSVIPITIVKT